MTISRVQDKRKHRVLIVVDVQNDFCPGGSLAVEGGDLVAAEISAYIKDTNKKVYDAIIFTRDWHIEPGAHFASTLGEEPDYLNTWPDHCVADTPGAEFHPNLYIPEDSTEQRVLFVYKGQTEAAYSGFEGSTLSELGSKPWTLSELLGRLAPDVVDVCGLATDYCVKATALDAAKNLYKVAVLDNLSAGVAEETTEAAIEEMVRAGIRIINV